MFFSEIWSVWGESKETIETLESFLNSIQDLQELLTGNSSDPNDSYEDERKPFGLNQIYEIKGLEWHKKQN